MVKHFYHPLHIVLLDKYVKIKTIGIGKHFNFRLHQQNQPDAQIELATYSTSLESKECIATSYKELCVEESNLKNVGCASKELFIL